MKKKCPLFLSVFVLLLILAGCGTADNHTPKIGVAFGVGPAARWPLEKQYMEDYAQETGIELEVRLNTDEAVKPFSEDCIELINSEIDVLIIRPRDVSGMKEVVTYARDHNVKIISYDSLIENEEIDLFVGYDSVNTGEALGRYLSEMVTEGNYLLIWGDTNRNVENMYRGAMTYLTPLKGKINILLEASVPGWSPDEAKRIFKETASKNGNRIDAVLAFNDKLAGACAEAAAELNMENPVVIAGMDAELDAVKRIAADTQSCTMYMDLKDLSCAAIDQAVNLAENKKLELNSETDNNSGSPIPSYLLTRQLVTKLNMDRILIEGGYYTSEQIYGTGSQQ